MYNVLHCMYSTLYFLNVMVAVLVIDPFPAHKIEFYFKS